jgi:hypothetical protein
MVLFLLETTSPVPPTYTPEFGASCRSLGTQFTGANALLLHVEGNLYFDHESIGKPRPSRISTISSMAIVMIALAIVS